MSKYPILDRILASEPNLKGYDPSADLFVHPGSPYKRGTPIPPEELKLIKKSLRDIRRAKHRKRYQK